MSADPLTPGAALRLVLLRGRYAVCRLPAQAALPDWVGTKRSQEELLSLTWRGDETSLVCPEGCVPPDVKAERGWRVVAVAGPLEFELVGVLSSLLEPLKKASVSVFALSTYDTDLLLIKEAHLDRALLALEQAGHLVE